MSEQVQDILLTDIVPGQNDRQLFKPAELDQLARSIRAIGLGQPITVRPHNGQYQIVAGERRFRAFRLLHEGLPPLPGEAVDPRPWDTIPAIVRTMTDEQVDALMLAENIQRADIDPIEEALAYQKRIERWKWTIKRCAQETHVSEGRVRDRLKPLNLMPEIQLMVRHGHFPIGHALAMTDLNKNYQLRAVELMKGEHLTQIQFSVICAELYAKQTQLSMFDNDTLFLEMQEIKQSLLNPQEDEPEAIAIPHSHATIYLVIQKEAGQTVRVNIDAIAAAIAIQEA